MVARPQSLPVIGQPRPIKHSAWVVCCADQYMFITTATQATVLDDTLPGLTSLQRERCCGGAAKEPPGLLISGGQMVQGSQGVWEQGWPGHSSSCLLSSAVES
jgi:hypothetical protein